MDSWIRKIADTSAFDQVNATKSRQVRSYRLRRVLINNEPNSLDLNSCFIHKLRIFDDQGSAYANFTNPERSPTNTPTSIVWDQLLASHGIIVLLPSDPYHRNVTRFDYQQFLSDFRLMPSITPDGFKRRIAFCIHKIDQATEDLSFEEYLDRNFNLTNIKRVLDEQFNGIKTFKISSSGYLPNGEGNFKIYSGDYLPDGERNFDFDQDTRGLIDKSSWNPKCATYPFYWMLEMFECDLLAKRSLELAGKYIPYYEDYNS